jgi:hypothetical protein
MTSAGMLKITIKKKFAAVLGADSAEVRFAWHGIDGEITVKTGKRHIVKLTLRGVNQKIHAVLPSGSTIWNSPLAVLATRVLDQASGLRVSQVEDDEKYVRLKFNAFDFIEGVS